MNASQIHCVSRRLIAMVVTHRTSDMASIVRSCCAPMLPLTKLRNDFHFIWFWFYQNHKWEVLHAEPLPGSRINWFRYRTVSRIPNLNTKVAYSLPLKLFLSYVRVKYSGPLCRIFLFGIELGVDIFVDKNLRNTRCVVWYILLILEKYYNLQWLILK